MTKIPLSLIITHKMGFDKWIGFIENKIFNLTFKGGSYDKSTKNIPPDWITDGINLDKLTLVGTY